MSRGSYLIDKVFLVFIAGTVALSIFFIIPPREIKDIEADFAYLDFEFNGLNIVIEFNPRLQLEDDAPIKEVQAKELLKIAKEYEDYYISIPRIDLEAPIIFNINAGNKDEYLKALENGIAHFRGTALPEDNKGNIFIFGHSSYYRNLPGNYKNVFKDLEKLELDDIINIHNDELFSFKVREIKIVEPDYTEAFNQDSDLRLTLMTCWPVGTSSKRLLVIAEPI